MGSWQSLPVASLPKPYAMAAARASLLRRHGLAAAAANPFLFSAHGLRYRKLEVILTKVIAPPPLHLSDFNPRYFAWPAA